MTGNSLVFPFRPRGRSIFVVGNTPQLRAPQHTPAQDQAQTPPPPWASLLPSQRGLVTRWGGGRNGAGPARPEVPDEATGTEGELGGGPCRRWVGWAQAEAASAPFPHSGGPSALLAKL